MGLPKPYYEDSACTFYCADCRDILPLLGPVDLVITDPPYGINFCSNCRKQKYIKINGDDNIPLDLIERCIDIASRAAYIFCRWDKLFLMPNSKSFLVWVKNNWSMGDLKHEHGRQWEGICFYPKDNHKFLKRIPDVIFCDKESTKYHPTEKPVDLIYKLIDCNVGNLIIDPFMGSGSTLRAAKDLGRKSIGIEIEEKYCEIAAKRLRQEVFNLD